MFRTTTAFLGLCVLLALAPLASASTVNFEEYSGTAGAVYTGPGAYTGDGQTTSATWNPTTSSGTTVAATGTYASDGSTIPLASQISFTSSQSVGVADTRSASTAGQVPDFLGQEAYYAGSFQLTNVAPGSYEIYLYSAIGYYSNGGEATAFTVTTSLSSPPAVISHESTDQSFVLDNGTVGNYDIVSVQVGSDGVINGSWTTAPGGNQSEFNGLQLVQVPEPASLGLITMATIPLLSRRRRN